MTDLRQAKEFSQYLKLQGWIVENINQNKVFVRKIPLTPFSIVKVQRPTRFDFKKIDRLARKHHALTVYLEPKISGIQNLESRIKKNNYRLARSPFLPTKTIHLDLTQSESKLLTQMKKDARYSIRKAEKGAKVQRYKGAKQIKNFHQAWKKSVPLSRHVPSFKNLRNLKSTFGPKAIFLTAAHTDTPAYRCKKIKTTILAGTIILLTETNAYYFYAFTSKQGRKMMAQYLLVWEAIKLAKKRGCKIFDFEGIYDKRFPIKNWEGFSHFKKSFGGQEVEYPGCFAKRKLRFPIPT